MPTSSTILFPLALLASSSVQAIYLPPNAPPPTIPVSSSFTVKLNHGSKREAEDGTILDWLVRERQRTDAKYGIQSKREGLDRRDTTITLQDENLDASYSGSVSVGTPAQTFDLILDTGSADLWVAGTECVSSACTGITTFDPSSSSTFTNLSSSFEISYGSGDAIGYAATDQVSLGGETVSNQEFAVVTDTDAGLISSPISGLMGLGFKALSTLDTLPWWQNLAENSWTEKVFAFRMARFRDDATATAVEEQGGYVDFGQTNTSRYTGDINYVTLTNQAYWQIPILGITVQGTEIDINTTVSSSSNNPFSSSTSSSETNPQAAIDTGTTLVSLPTDVAARVYEAISGAEAVTASGHSGYYQYPCSTDVSVALNFGGIYYTISAADFNIGRLTSGSSYCLGGIYGVDLGSTSIIQSIVGATFLKNVYSVFKYSGSESGSQVGFASLADGSTVTSGSAGNSTQNTSTGGTSSGSGSTSSNTSAAAASFAPASAMLSIVVALGLGSSFFL